MLIITNIPFDERLNFRIDNSGFKVISFIDGFYFGCKVESTPETMKVKIVTVKLSGTGPMVALLW